MERYQVILAYDGTRYKGYQRQASHSGKPEAVTIQRAVENALYQLGWQGKSVEVAGRTDTGVHASGQVIAFNLEWKHTLHDLRRALNAYLPFDIAARTVSRVPQNFRPRYAATHRFYRYRLFCDEVRDPLRERFAWRVWPAVDMTAMQNAAQRLTGEHDFAAFGSPARRGSSTVRHITRAQWLEDGPDYVFEIIGSGFLYHMVRRLVFFLVGVGQAKLEPERITSYLTGMVASPITGVAPPNGLTLVEVGFKQTGGSI
jgi:tRNA pseudouridine38-40 synthase